jgi:hypothetical protein
MAQQTPYTEEPILIGFLHKEDHYDYDLSDSTVDERRPITREELWLDIAQIPGTLTTPGVPPPQSAYPGTASYPVSGISNVLLAGVVGNPQRFASATPGQFSNMVPANYAKNAYRPTLKDATGKVIPYDPKVWVADGVRGLLEFKYKTPTALGYKLPLNISYWRYIGTFPGSGSSGLTGVNNEGSGVGIYDTTVANIALLRSLLAATAPSKAGIEITNTGQTITIGNTMTGSNFGSGVRVFEDKDPAGTGALRFNTLTAVVSSGMTVAAPGSAPGAIVFTNTMTGDNLGSGRRVFASKNPATGKLELRSLTQGAGITLTETATEILIAATGGSGVASVVTEGTGVPVVDPTGTPTAVKIRSILADTLAANRGLAVAPSGSGNEIVISNTMQGANLGATSPTRYRVYSAKNAITGDLEFRQLVAGSNIMITENANELIINASGSAGGITSIDNDPSGPGPTPGLGSIWESTVAGAAKLRTLKADTAAGFEGIEITTTGPNVVIGNLINGSSPATGAPVFVSKLASGVMQFNSILGAGSGISVTAPPVGTQGPIVIMNMSPATGVTLTTPTAGLTLVATAGGNGPALKLKSLLAGAGIIIADVSDQLTFSVDATVYTVKSIANEGGGIEVYDTSSTLGAAKLRTFKADTAAGQEGIQITNTATNVIVGNTLTGNNAATGTGLGLLFINKTLVSATESNLNFRRIKGSANLTVATVMEDVVLTVAGVVLSVASGGTGVPVLDPSSTATAALIRSILADITPANLGIAVAAVGNDVVVSNTMTGDSLGGGVAVWTAKNATTGKLEFRSLFAGSNITLDTTTTPGQIIINATGTAGGITSIANDPVGGGTGLIWESTTAGAALLRTLIAATGVDSAISVVTGANTIAIGNKMIGETPGAAGSPVYASKNALTGNLVFNNIAAAVDSSIVVSVPASNVISIGVNSAVYQIKNVVSEGSALSVPVLDPGSPAGVATIRSIVADTAAANFGISVTAGGTDVFIGNTMTGANLGSSVGIVGIWASKNATTGKLEFKSLKPGSNISFNTAVSGEIEINATGSAGGVTSIANDPLGGTAGLIWESTTAGAALLRTLSVAAGIESALSITTGANTITIGNKMIGETPGATGESIYSSKNASTGNLIFNKIAGSANLTVSAPVSNVITLAVAGVVLLVSSVPTGTGLPIYDPASTATAALIRKIRADTTAANLGIAVTTAAGDIIVGNTMTGDSLGGGVPVYVAKNATTGKLEFRSLFAGSNITLDTTTTPGQIIISASGSAGGVTSIANDASGGGTGLIWESTISGAALLRALIADATVGKEGIEITTVGSNVVIGNKIIGASFGGGVPIYVSKTAAGVLQFNTLSAGTGVTITAPGSPPGAITIAAVPVTLTSISPGLSLVASTSTSAAHITKSLIATPLGGVLIADAANQLSFSVDPAVYMIKGVASVGTSVAVLDGTVSGVANLRSLRADTAAANLGAAVTLSGQSIVIGNTMTGANIGAGTGLIWSAKNATTGNLEFRSLVAGSNITLDVSNPSQITINASGSAGGITSIDNDPSGAGPVVGLGSIWESTVAGAAKLRTLIADTAAANLGIKVTTLGPNVIISNTMTGTTPGTGVAIFVDKDIATGNLRFNSLIAGLGISVAPPSGSPPGTITIANTVALTSVAGGVSLVSSTTSLATHVTKSISATALGGITITDNSPATNQIAFAVDSAVYTVKSLASVGTGVATLDGVVSGAASLRSVRADLVAANLGAAVTLSGQSVVIGNTMTGANIGAGTGLIWSAKNATTGNLEFRSLVAGSNITLDVSNPLQITINAAGSAGGITSIDNTPSGSGPIAGFGSIWASTTAGAAVLRTLIADTASGKEGIQIATVGSNVVVSNTMTGSTPGTGVPVWVDKTVAGVLRFNTLSAGAGITVTAPGSSPGAITIATVPVTLTSVAGGVSLVSATSTSAAHVTKSISATAGGGIVITDNSPAANQVAFAVDSAVYMVKSLASVGTGIATLDGVVSGAASLRSVRADLAAANLGISVTLASQSIVVGNTMTGANIGAGTGLIWSAKNASTGNLEFRSLVAGSNITLDVSNPLQITINAASASVTLTSVAGGVSLVSSTSTSAAHITKSISATAGGGIVITDNSPTLNQIAFAVDSAVYTVKSLNSVGTGIATLDGVVSGAGNLRSVRADLAAANLGISVTLASQSIVIGNTMTGTTPGTGVPVWVDKEAATGNLRFNSLLAGTGVTVTAPGSSPGAITIATVPVTLTSVAGAISLVSATSTSAAHVTKSISATAGGGVTITDNSPATNQVAFAVDSAVYTIKSLNSVGTGVATLDSVVSGAASLRSVRADLAAANLGISVTLASQSIVVGNTMTGTTPGTGVPIWVDKDIATGNLRFNSLLAGTGMTVTAPGSSPGAITITNSSPASAITLSSVGTGATLIASNVNPTFTLKSLIAGTGVTISSTATGITINSTSSGVATVSNDVGGGVEIYDTTTSTPTAARLRTLRQGKGLGVIQASPIATQIEITADEVSSLGVDLVPATLDLFVSTAGNDTTGDGTAGLPFATLERAFREIRVVGYDDTSSVTIQGATYALAAGVTNLGQGSRGRRATPIVIKGAARTVLVASTAIQTITADSTAGGQYTITLAAAPATPLALGQIVRFTSGAAAGFDCFISKVISTTSFALPLSLSATPPVAADTFSLERNTTAVTLATGASAIEGSAKTLIIRDIKLVFPTSAPAQTALTFLRQHTQMVGVWISNQSDIGVLSFSQGTLVFGGALLNAATVSTQSTLGVLLDSTAAAGPGVFAFSAAVAADGFRCTNSAFVGAGGVNFTFTGAVQFMTQCYLGGFGQFVLNTGRSQIASSWFDGCRPSTGAGNIDVTDGADVVVASTRIDHSQQYGVRATNNAQLALSTINIVSTGSPLAAIYSENGGHITMTLQPTLTLTSNEAIRLARNARITSTSPTGITVPSTTTGTAAVVIDQGSSMVVLGTLTLGGAPSGRGLWITAASRLVCTNVASTVATTLSSIEVQDSALHCAGLINCAGGGVGAGLTIDRSHVTVGTTLTSSNNLLGADGVTIRNNSTVYVAGAITTNFNASNGISVSGSNLSVSGAVTAGSNTVAGITLLRGAKMECQGTVTTGSNTAGGISLQSESTLVAGAFQMTGNGGAASVLVQQSRLITTSTTTSTFASGNSAGPGLKALDSMVDLSATTLLFNNNAGAGIDLENSTFITRGATALTLSTNADVGMRVVGSIVDAGLSVSMSGNTSGGLATSTAVMTSGVVTKVRENLISFESLTITNTTAFTGAFLIYNANIRSTRMYVHGNIDVSNSNAITALLVVTASSVVYCGGALTANASVVMTDAIQVTESSTLAVVGGIQAIGDGVSTGPIVGPLRAITISGASKVAVFSDVTVARGTLYGIRVDSSEMHIGGRLDVTRCTNAGGSVGISMLNMAQLRVTNIVTLSSCDNGIQIFHGSIMEATTNVSVSNSNGVGINLFNGAKYVGSTGALQVTVSTSSGIVVAAGSTMACGAITQSGSSGAGLAITQSGVTATSVSATSNVGTNVSITGGTLNASLSVTATGATGAGSGGLSLVDSELACASIAAGGNSGSNIALTRSRVAATGAIAASSSTGDAGLNCTDSTLICGDTIAASSNLLAGLLLTRSAVTCVNLLTASTTTGGKGLDLIGSTLRAGGITATNSANTNISLADGSEVVSTAAISALASAVNGIAATDSTLRGTSIDASNCIQANVVMVRSQMLASSTVTASSSANRNGITLENSKLESASTVTADGNFLSNIVMTASSLLSAGDIAASNAVDATASGINATESAIVTTGGIVASSNRRNIVLVASTIEALNTIIASNSALSLGLGTVGINMTRSAIAAAILTADANSDSGIVMANGSKIIASTSMFTRNNNQSGIICNASVLQTSFLQCTGNGVTGSSGLYSMVVGRSSEVVIAGTANISAGNSAGQNNLNIREGARITVIGVLTLAAGTAGSNLTGTRLLMDTAASLTIKNGTSSALAIIGGNSSSLGILARDFSNICVQGNINVSDHNIGITLSTGAKLLCTNTLTVTGGNTGEISMDSQAIIETLNCTMTKTTGASGFITALTMIGGSSFTLLPSGTFSVQPPAANAYVSAVKLSQRSAFSMLGTGTVNLAGGAGILDGIYSSESAVIWNSGTVQNCGTGAAVAAINFDRGSTGNFAGSATMDNSGNGILIQRGSRVHLVNVAGNNVNYGVSVRSGGHATFTNSSMTVSGLNGACKVGVNAGKTWALMNTSQLQHVNDYSFPAGAAAALTSVSEMATCVPV